MSSTVVQNGPLFRIEKHVEQTFRGKRVQYAWFVPATEDWDTGYATAKQAIRAVERFCNGLRATGDLPL